jgi:hypothetical protein
VHELGRVSRLHAHRGANPSLACALERLAAWQAKRLALTYADLAAEPRYADAIVFFQTDLYGNADFAQRDADLARIVPAMVLMLPERVIASIAQAMELNALSQELDRTLLGRLPRRDGTFTVADYCRAYRDMGDRPARERQIELIGEIGAALDVFVTKPLIGMALVMMRQPARLSGFGVLHDFLERGFAAFEKMHGAREFLATIDSRERNLMDAMFAGDDAPFRDPVEGADAAAGAGSPDASPSRRGRRPGQG